MTLLWAPTDRLDKRVLQQPFLNKHSNRSLKSQKKARASADTRSEEVPRSQGLPWLRRVRPLSHAFTFIIIVALPLLFSRSLWLAIWLGDNSRAWDGTGHFALAQIYDEVIFPNSLGWTNAYFGGMPFPNFYPPVFYVGVAFLHRSHIFSFPTAFKLAVTIPVLLAPAAVWLLARYLSNRNNLIATAAALGTTLLLVDVRLMGSLLAGLDYFSTFQIGLYTQPLGFVLMIAWYLIYAECGAGYSALERGALASKSGAADSRMALLERAGEVIESRPRSHSDAWSWRIALASLLLALTLLSNFFNAMTAAVFILTTLANDVTQRRRAKTRESKSIQKRLLISHLVSPIVALLLSLFWLVPVLTEYRYFVTRPYLPEAKSLFSPWLLGWYAVALLGSIVWIQQGARTIAREAERVDAVHMPARVR